MLHGAAEQEVYGFAMIESRECWRHGYNLSTGIQFCGALRPDSA